MDKRDTAIELAIVAGSTSALTACVIIAARAVNDPGDILGFFGSAIGAGLAVVGALWVERRKSKQLAISEKNLIAQSLIMIGTATNGILNEDEVDILAYTRSFEQNMQAFGYLMSKISITDAMVYAALNTVLFWSNRYIAAISPVAERMSNTSGAKYDQDDLELVRNAAEKMLGTVKLVLAQRPMFDKSYLTILNNITGKTKQETPS